MKIGVFGAGRLGSAIRDQIHAPNELVWVADEGDVPTQAVDVAIDASVAEAVEGHVRWAIDHRVDLVIGATGWSFPDLEAQVAGRIGVLIAPNFSLSVALMQRLAGVLARYSALTGTSDPYVLEHHHRMKADYPSGTAKMLANAVLANHPGKREWTLGTAEEGQLSMGVIRAGSEFGMHIVGLDGPAETLELKHHARSRAVFAEGAVRAATWIRGKKGVFQFSDLAAEVLDPLFQIGAN